MIIGMQKRHEKGIIFLLETKLIIIFQFLGLAGKGKGGPGPHIFFSLVHCHFNIKYLHMKGMLSLYRVVLTEIN